MAKTTEPGLRQYVKLLISRPRWGFHWLIESYHNKTQRRRHSSRFNEYTSYAHSAKEVLSYLGHPELDPADNVLEELKALQSDTGTPAGRAIKSFMPEDVAQLCYGIVRLTKPSAIIETGVQRGNTSFYMLKALQMNKKGNLYSIEFPVPGTENSVGELVPQSLKDRWSLIFGIGLEEMGKLRQKIPEIDLFLHDSDHTYKNQIAEYRFALSWLKRGGVLISDDVDNNAFIEACEEFGVEPLVIKQSWPYYVGVAVRK